MNAAAPLRALLLVTLAVTSLRAQEGTRPLELLVAPETGELTVRLGDLLEDPSLRNALLSGLPLRIRIVAELWRDGLFDSESGRAEWRATVVHDPLARTYLVESSGETGERVVSSPEEASTILRRSFHVPLIPERQGRYYYLAHVEVETLSLSDLEELGRWLRGDLAPAVAGEEDMEGAVAKGVRRLVVRVLGLPARRFRMRTPTFEVPGAEGQQGAGGEGWAGETARPEQDQRTSILRTASASMRPTSGVTAIPGPGGSESMPSTSSNSGSTRSLSQ